MNGHAGFDRVDGSADPDGLVAYLDASKELPVMRELGRLLVAELRLRPGSHVLDVGCGTGADARAMAAAVAPAGRVVGIDASARMVEVARRRTAGAGASLEFRVGRAERLDLPSNTFDACRFERVLQHVASPASALREAARVLRPGAQVAALEPDWQCLELTGAGARLTRRVLGVRLRTIRSPDVGARLSALLAAAGFVEVRSIEVRVSGSHREALDSLRLGSYAAEAVRAGVVTEVESAAWLREVAAAAESGGLGVRVSLHLGAGTRSGQRRA